MRSPFRLRRILASLSHIPFHAIEAWLLRAAIFAMFVVTLTRYVITHW